MYRKISFHEVSFETFSNNDTDKNWIRLSEKMKLSSPGNGCTNVKKTKILSFIFLVEEKNQSVYNHH